MVNLPNSAGEGLVCTMAEDHIQILREIQSQVMDVRERLIRLETYGFHERLQKMDDGADIIRDRLTVLETQGRLFSAGVSAGVALIISLVGVAITYVVGRA
jgi:hypothetical protein